MQFSTTLRRVLGAITVAAGMLGSTAGHAGPSFSNLYFFGDSLSDTGNLYTATGGPAPNVLDGPPYPQSPSYFEGRFSNGPVWAEYFANALGLSNDAKAVLLGGNNFAVGGDTVLVPRPGSTTLQIQLGTYLGLAGGADPNALYAIMGGTNDVADMLANPGLQSLIPGDFDLAVAQILGQLGDVINALGQMVVDLYLAGARHILLANIPDLADTPLVQLSPLAGFSPTITQLSALFGMGIDGIDQNATALVGLDLDVLDLFGLGKAAKANPNLFGFTNVTDPCVFGEPSLNGSGNTCAPGLYDAAGHLYWDVEHPTTDAHRLIADAALNAVPLPSTLSLVLLALALTGWTLSRRRAMARF